MLNLLLRTIIILTIFYSSNLSGLEPYEDDMELSKKSFLISGVDFKEKAKGNGVMTLCFKTPRDSTFTYEHAALVFEMFIPKSPNDVFVSMIHYVGEEDCCCGKNMHPSVDKHELTVSKVYRGLQKNELTGEKFHRPTAFVKYASWVLPNEALKKGYTLATNDGNAHEIDKSLYDSYSCISYVQRIMREVGLRKVDFGCWLRRATNLKILVDDYIRPKPSKKNYLEIGLPIPKTDSKEKEKVKTPKSVDMGGAKSSYAALLLNAAIQNEKDLPDVAILQYQQLTDMGFFNEA